MALNRTACTHRRGFTVVEILVVVGIIAVLVAMLFPAFSRVRASARSMKCLANQRQITMANQSYANDNKGNYVSPRTDTSGVSSPNNLINVLHPWVMANGSNITGTFELPAALEQGKLYPYIGNKQTYLSPDEPTNPDAVAASNATTRIRSYSMNALVGVSRPDEWQAMDSVFGALGVPMTKFKTTSIGRIPQPARTLSTIVEDDNAAFNKQGWLVEPIESKWIDWPASWRADAIAMSFMDGSVDTYALKNNALAQEWDAHGHDWVQPADAVAGYAVDWKFFRDRLLPGVIPNTTTFGGD